jgi:hypothetical protein
VSGNNVVGENLPNFLNTYQSGMNWMDCVNQRYREFRFADLARAYQRLADLRDADVFPTRQRPVIPNVMVA